MQILAFEGTGYKIVSGIFSFVARVYDVMITLSKAGKDAGTIEKFAISDIATVMYTIAGVFMLFRVTIAMINMLINPDVINDSKAGAGKLITRIVTSILMLIAFIPNGWIFGGSGILNRIEQAALSNGGLIEKILPESAVISSDDNSKSTSGSNSGSSDSSNSNQTADTLKDGINQVRDIADTAAQNAQDGLTMSGMIDNVYAAQTKMECYYVFISHNYNEGAMQKMTAGDENSVLNKSEIGISKVLHLTLYPDSESGKNDLCTDGFLSNKCKYSYNADTNSPYSDFNKKIVWDGLNDGWPSKYDCPNTITEGGNAKDSSKSWDDDSNSGKYVGGWHSESAMSNAVSAGDYKVNATGDKAEEIRKLLGLSGGAFLGGVSGEAISFAQMAMGTFISCNNDSECDKLKASTLVTNGKDIINKWKNDQIGLDFIPAVIAGVGILIWVLVLCVDIIVRRFKLLLLQMIAPIPIISYVDPNDQTFEKWRKMYTSTYLDLFIKLIAISLALYLLRIVSVIYQDNNNTILKFFYIVAILVFAKMIPSMISEIFGINNLSGSFNDIVGMPKKMFNFGRNAVGKAATFGTTVAGAGLGAYVGVKTAEGGFGRAMWQGTKGFFRGAGSGSKRNIYGGASNIADENERISKDNANGISTIDRMLMDFKEKAGFKDYAAQVDIELKPQLDLRDFLKELASSKGKVADVAFGSDFIKSVYAWRQAGHSISDDRIRSLAEAWAGEQVKMSRGEGGYRTDDWIKSEKQRLNYDSMNASEQAATDARLKQQKIDYNASKFKYNTRQFSDIYQSDDFTFEFDKIYDGGNAGALDGMLKDLTATLQGRPDVAQIVGMNSIDTVADTGRLAANAWNNTGGINDINEVERQRTKGNTQYVEAVRRRNQGSGKDNGK